MRTLINHLFTRLFVAALTLSFVPAGVTYTLAQDESHEHHISGDQASLAQVVALDECDPTTFNAVLGPDFCKNIALGYQTTFNDLFKEAQDKSPDPKWDFEPDTVHIHEGAILSVVDQGGEPHLY